MSGSDDDRFIIQHHFCDSLSCLLSSVISPQSRVLDIGTGAGFPGIPLKIYYPGIHLTLVDAVLKKIMFLRHLCRSLNLDHTECLAVRLPSLSDSKQRQTLPDALAKAQFDVVVSRAVGTVPFLLDLACPLLAPNGHLVLQRGKYGMQESEECQELFRQAGLRMIALTEVPLSFLTHPRYLLILRRLEKRRSQK